LEGQEGKRVEAQIRRGKERGKRRIVFVLETKSFFFLRKRSLFTSLEEEKKQICFFKVSSAPPPSLTRTWGAAVPQDGIDEVQSSIVSDKHAPSRCVGSLGGDAIDEQDPVDAHAGDAVGNHKVPKRTEGKGSKNWEAGKGCFAAVISHHDIVDCRARHSLSSTPQSPSQNHKKICCDLLYLKNHKKNRTRLSWAKKIIEITCPGACSQPWKILRLWLQASRLPEGRQTLATHHGGEKKVD
jgi:hypothetical protein